MKEMHVCFIFSSTCFLVMITSPDLGLSKRAPVDHMMVWVSCLRITAAHHSGCVQCGCDLITDWTFLGSIYTFALTQPVYNPVLTNQRRRRGAYVDMNHM